MHKLADLVSDRPQEQFFGVSRSLFTSPELFELELEHIFEGGWIYLAHESQLPRPNDYFTTTIGRRSVFLTRNSNGEIRAFRNACAHRGAALCHSERGNKRVFVCPYHGWSYDADGRNAHVKARETGGYPEQFNQQPHDLDPLPRLEEYRGFVFGSLCPDVPPLKEHLGAAAGFIDLLVDQSPDGLEVLKGASTYRFRGNWKLQAENGVDGYHFTTVHQSYTKLLQRRGTRLQQTGEDAMVRTGFDHRTWGTEAGTYDLGNGHVLFWIVGMTPTERPLWERREDMERQFGAARADWMLSRHRNLLLFPNVQLNDHNSTQIRVIRPLSPDLTEVRNYCFAPRGESPRARERRVRQFADFFNASGLATPDDLAIFEHMQVGCNAGPTLTTDYQRGLARLHPGGDTGAHELGIAPAASGNHAQDETHHHGWYRQWAKMIHAKG